MRSPFIYSCLIIILLLSNMSAAEIYKTVDKNGHTVYTDLPPSDTNAKALELKKTNTAPKTEVIPGLVPTSVARASGVDYQVVITSPENGRVLKPEERELNIEASLNQALQDGDSFDFMIDGASIEKTTESGITLTEPPRGEHKITVKITNSRGNTLTESAPVTVIIQRPIRKAK